MKPATNSIGVELQPIIPGQFMMGSPASEECRWQHEGPQHLVKITRPFYLGKFPLTVGEFRLFIEHTGYVTEAERDGKGGFAWVNQDSIQDPVYNWRNVGFVQEDRLPVVNVSWNDAIALCRWLSETEGRRYRLPTEAEWEYACRAGTTTAFHFGDTLSSTQANFDGEYPYGDAPDGPFVEKTSVVGSYASNGFGLYDMHGNVWEWCADWYDSDYYSRSPVENPVGPESGGMRVIRGGGWRSFGEFCRSAFRYSIDPCVSDYPYGFRIACDIEGD